MNDTHSRARRDYYLKQINDAENAVYRSSLARGAIVDATREPIHADTSSILHNDAVPSTWDTAFYARAYLRSLSVRAANDETLNHTDSTFLVVQVEIALKNTDEDFC
jgi:hypothetical protein